MDDSLQAKTFNIPDSIQSQLKAVSDRFSKILKEFDPITLKEMDSVKLMNRIDTKYIVNIDTLTTLFEMAKEQYRVVVIEDSAISPYTTIYYDTESADMYTKHHNKKRNRYKIRTRTYLNPEISFLEIKHKNNKGRVTKSRIRIPVEEFIDTNLTLNSAEFIDKRSPYQTETLYPRLQNYFQRVTLVDKRKTERVTIDLGVFFKNMENDTIDGIENMAIIEMKQDGAVRSAFKDYLDHLSIKPASMSKYCLGMVMLDSKIKKNRFKLKVRTINKITSKNVTI